MAEDNGFKLALALEDRIVRGDLGGLEVVVAIQIKRLMIRTRKEAIEQKAVAASLPGKNYDNIRKAIIGLERKGVIARESGAVRFTLSSGGNHRQPVEITGQDEEVPVEITGSTGGNHRTGPVEITGNETSKPANDGMATPVSKLSLETTLETTPLTPLSEVVEVASFIKDVYGVTSVEEAKQMGEDSKKMLREFLRFPQDIQLRAVRVTRDFEGVEIPASYALAVARNPAKFPAPKVVTFSKPETWLDEWKKGQGTQIDRDFACRILFKYARVIAQLPAPPEPEVWKMVDTQGLDATLTHYRALFLEERRRKGVVNG